MADKIAEDSKVNFWSFVKGVRLFNLRFIFISHLFIDLFLHCSSWSDNAAHVPEKISRIYSALQCILSVNLCMYCTGGRGEGGLSYKNDSGAV